MADLLLVFLSGLLGSGHCVGMCGAFAMAIGWNTRGMANSLARQATYSVGRASTYTFLGAAAGFAGQRLQGRLSWMTSAQGGLSVLAGSLLLLAGLAAAGWLPFRATWWHRATACPAAAQFRALLKSPDLTSVFVAGLATGFLPCGLVYALLALAGGSASVLQGMLIMGTFALGTMPLMMLTGWGSSFLTVSTRTKLMKFAACSVIVMGGLTIARGATAIAASQHEETPRCPLCHPTSPSMVDKL